MTLRRWDDRAISCVAARSFCRGISLAPLLWLVYNGAVYRNPLEFANGPYSAKAIEQRTAKLGIRDASGRGKPDHGGQFFSEVVLNWIWRQGTGGGSGSRSRCRASLQLLRQFRAQSAVLLLWSSSGLLCAVDCL